METHGREKIKNEAAHPSQVLSSKQLVNIDSFWFFASSPDGCVSDVLDLLSGHVLLLNLFPHMFNSSTVD